MIEASSSDLPFLYDLNCVHFMSLVHKPFQARVWTRMYRTRYVHVPAFAGFVEIFACLDSVVLLVSGREGDASQIALACSTTPIYPAHTRRGKPRILAIFLTILETL